MHTVNDDFGRMLTKMKNALGSLPESAERKRNQISLDMSQSYFISLYLVVMVSAEFHLCRNCLVVSGAVLLANLVNKFCTARFEKNISSVILHRKS